MGAHSVSTKRPYRIIRFLFWEVEFLVFKHILYPVMLQRKRAWYLLQTAYWTGTIYCNCVLLKSIHKIGVRAGNLAVIFEPGKMAKKHRYMLTDVLSGFGIRRMKMRL